jgi:hypothetical protein
VEISDPSAFSHTLRVEGVEVDGYRVLRVKSPAVPNAIAAVLLAMRDSTGTKPQCYFEWSEGSPISHLMRYLFLGQGDTPPLVREILREVEPDKARHPRRLSIIRRGPWLLIAHIAGPASQPLNRGATPSPSDGQLPIIDPSSTRAGEWGIRRVRPPQSPPGCDGLKPYRLLGLQIRLVCAFLVGVKTARPWIG